MKGAFNILAIAAMGVAVSGGSAAKAAPSAVSVARGSHGWFLHKAERRDTWLYVAGSDGK